MQGAAAPRVFELELLVCFVYILYSGPCNPFSKQRSVQSIDKRKRMKNFKKVLNARRLKHQKKLPSSTTKSVTTTSSIALMQQYLLEPRECLFTNKPYYQPEDKSVPHINSREASAIVNFKKSVTFCNFSYPTPSPTDTLQQSSGNVNSASPPTVNVDFSYPTPSPTNTLQKSSGNVNSASPPTVNLDDSEIQEGDSINTSSLSSPLSYGLTCK